MEQAKQVLRSVLLSASPTEANKPTQTVISEDNIKFEQ